MSKKKYVKIIIVLILVFFGYYNQDIIQEESKNILSLSQNEVEYKNYSIKYNLEEELNSDIEVVFCPSNECFNLLENSFELAKEEIKCAFYELDEINLSKKLLEKSREVNIGLVIDDKYLEEDSITILAGSNIKIYSDTKRGTRYNNYMHDKFCVIDDKILISGSTNPTTNGIYKNNNNLIKIESEYLAKNYENEFNQMASNVYGTNKESVLEYNNISFSFGDDRYLISSYMCPQDDCAKEVINILDKANEEILFATFAITNDDIKEKLIEKYNEDILIQGLIERRNYNLKGSDVKEMREYFEIKNDTNTNNMHHKFFVVDERYVITGSMNPSGSGVDYNDENILIIDNSRIANLYKDEFLRLYN